MNVAVHVLALTDSNNDWMAHTRELLGDAARIAARLQGTLSAWVLSASDDAKPVTNDSLQELAKHGCDRVDRLIHERFANWSSEAIAAALSANTAESCRVIFLPGTPRGEEAAALLSVQLETQWFADVLTVSVTRNGILEFTSIEPGGKLSRTHRMQSDRPVVVTIRPGVAETRSVNKPNRVVVRDVAVDLSDVPELTTVEEFLPADPATIDIRFARRVVAGGRGTGGPDGMKLLAELAESIGGSLAASRMAVDLGWAENERQVGQTGKTVSPDLYVACGISGATHHLAGMRDSKHIVAINPDARAPIHEVAHLSLCGDLHQVVPAIQSAIARRKDG